MRSRGPRITQLPERIGAVAAERVEQRSPRAAIPAGATTVSFPVAVAKHSNSVNVGISALFQNRGHSGQLGVTSAQGGTLLKASATNEVLEPRPVNDPNTTVLGFYQGGTASLESGCHRVSH